MAALAISLLIFTVIVSTRPNTNASSLLTAPLRLRVFFTLLFSTSIDVVGISIKVAGVSVSASISATRVVVTVRYYIIEALLLLTLRLIEPYSIRLSSKELVTDSSLSLYDLIRLIRLRLARLASF